MAALFLPLRVLNRFEGNTVIKWGYLTTAGRTLSAQESVDIEWSRTGTADWHKLENAIFVDDTTALDPRKRLFGKGRDLFYRVKLKAGGKVYYSDATQTGIDYDKSTWLKFKEMYRLAVLTYKNTPDRISSCLLKRRHWGVRCHNCVDDGTGYVQKERCLVCFGTGIVGGYYPPVPVYVQEQIKQKRAKWAGSQAIYDQDKRHEATMIAFPVAPEERDVLVNTSTDERFYIAAVSQSVVRTDVKLGNLNLIKTFDMDMAPVSDVIYEFPMDACNADGLADPEKECPVVHEEVECGPESAEEVESGADVPVEPGPTWPQPSAGPGGILWPE